MPPISRHEQRRRIGLRAVLTATGLACACLAQAGTGTPANADRLSREEEAIVCLDLKSIATLKADTATLEDMSARVQRMQGTVAELRALIEAMPVAGEDGRPAASAPPAAAKPVPVPSPTPAPAATEGLPMEAIAGGGVVAALILLLLLQRQRKAAATTSAQLESPATRMDDFLPPTEDMPLPAEPANVAPEAPVPPPLPAVPAATEPPAALPAAAVAVPIADAFAATELPEVDQALELADVMVSMGLTQGAADTLVDRIRANPRRALYHWLKLLDIYKGAGNKDEFEKSATELRRNFNIQADEWQTDAVKPERSIEDYGHLCTRIQELWSRPGCTDYLARLLDDNRGGARLGFPQAVAEEILFLISIQRNRA